MCECYDIKKCNSFIKSMINDLNLECVSASKDQLDSTTYLLLSNMLLSLVMVLISPSKYFLNGDKKQELVFEINSLSIFPIFSSH